MLYFHLRVLYSILKIVYTILDSRSDYNLYGSLFLVGL